MEGRQGIRPGMASPERRRRRHVEEVRSGENRDAALEKERREVASDVEEVGSSEREKRDKGEREARAVQY